MLGCFVFGHFLLGVASVCWFCVAIWDGGARVIGCHLFIICGNHLRFIIALILWVGVFVGGLVVCGVRNLVGFGCGICRVLLISRSDCGG